MGNDSQMQQHDSIPFISIVPFLLITFVISWGVLALYIFLSEPMNRLFGQLDSKHPLFYLAVWSPAIAALVIVGFKTGSSGVWSFLSKALLWRSSCLWYLFLFTGMPLIFYAGAAWKGNLFSDPFPFPTIQSLLIAVGLMIIKGPVEEFGWRGFVLPLMQRRCAPFWAGVIIGVTWGFWHLPAFVLSGLEHSNWSFVPFFLGVVAISLIMTALFNDSKGSILLPAVLHFQLINPVWPDAQPYDTYILAIVAAVLVVIQGKKMFSKSSAVTRIVPQTVR